MATTAMGSFGEAKKQSVKVKVPVQYQASV